MLYYNFRNYSEFQLMYGFRENGSKERRNKILLSYIKQKKLLHAAVFGDVEAQHRLNITSMPVLFRRVMDDLYHKSGCTGVCRLNLNGFVVYSDQFALDEYEGLCEDGDSRSIRYKNTENGRVFKMKSGKFLRKVMEECGFLGEVPEQISTWVCEEFATRWQSYAAGRLPNYELHVDDDFNKIYDGDECTGNFHSCMVGKGYDSFYANCVDAKAAYLTNADGYVVARCIVFTNVKDDETGEKLRLAERQYSSDGDLVLQRVLVDKLIAAGEIDGYKQVGAGCHDSNSFVSNTGESWYDRSFSIPCVIDMEDDYVSYQDSFKWWNMSENKAYNYRPERFDGMLDTTGGRVEGCSYDSWHQEYTCDAVVPVYYHGTYYTCSDCRLGDFEYIYRGSGAHEYHHHDDVVYVEDECEYVLEEDTYYSELLEAYYYHEYRKEEAELEYKKEHWFYSEYDDEYFENEEDITFYIDESGCEVSISVNSAEYLEGYERNDEDGKYYKIAVEEAA